MTNGVCVMIEKNGKYLMIQQAATKPFAFKWLPVSGSIEPGETPPQAAHREVLEETSLKIEILRETAILPADYKSKNLHFLLTRWLDGEVHADPQEINAFGWFTYEELQKLDVMNANKIFFEKYFKPY